MATDRARSGIIISEEASAAAHLRNATAEISKEDLDSNRRVDLKLVEVLEKRERELTLLGERVTQNGNRDVGNPAMQRGQSVQADGLQHSGLPRSTPVSEGRSREGDNALTVLQHIATRLREREASFWYTNGLDLLEAKSLVEHGKWLIWLSKNVAYSDSKANKMMMAADCFRLYLTETVKITDLPRASDAYRVAAAKLPAELRERTIQRLLQRDPKAMSEFQREVNKLRKDEKVSKPHAQPIPPAEIKMGEDNSENERSGSGHDASDDTHDGPPRANPSGIQPLDEAVRQLREQLGDKLKQWLDLVRTAGLDAVFAKLEAEADALCTDDENGSDQGEVR